MDQVELGSRSGWSERMQSRSRSVDGRRPPNTQYTDETIWPEGFDPKVAGAVLMTQ